MTKGLKKLTQFSKSKDHAEDAGLVEGVYQLTKRLRELTHEQEDMLDALKVESERDERSKWGARGPLSTSRQEGQTIIHTYIQ